MDKLLEIQGKYNRYEDTLEEDFMDIEIPMAVADTVPYLLRKIKTYEKALKEISEYGGTDMLGSTCAKLAKETLG